MFDFAPLVRSLEVVQYLLGAIAVAPLFPFLYVVVTWRSRESARSGAGTYAMLLYFASLGLLLLVAGSANLVYGWLSTTEIRPFLTRLSWALFVGGAVFLGLHALVLRLVPGRAAWADVRRIFGGFLMTIAGMVSLAALVLLLITLFHEIAPDDEQGAIQRIDDLKLYGSWTVFYLATYLGAVASMTAVVRRRG